ncbi:Aspartokinase [Geodia barretti]|uniref:Aspartokinase n=1 Tax=Geodia barretti TaxID=519541 RepID=A0AA35WI07_GEOBA|nr:Aspartokinase [Geodia barretti]
MPLIVQKYGGSSVADAERIINVAKRIGAVQKSGAAVVVVVSAMGDTTDELIELAHTISHEPHAREMDLLLSTGELVSSTLLTMALRELGHEAISLSGPQAGIRTDTSFGRARISRIEPARVRRELDAGRIVVVAGFQGITAEDDITTLGRGGSDTTAVAIAAALQADRCEIYTDVEGIYTADPRIVSGARKIDEVGYEEMLELASLGAKMHPRSIELGGVYRVPIYVASSFSDTPGTLIHARLVEGMAQQLGAAGVVSSAGLAAVSIVGSGMQNTPGYASRMFRLLANGGVNIDMITTSEIRISCIIDESQGRDAVRLLHEGFQLDRS